MLSGSCGRGDCTGDCNECLEREEGDEEVATGDINVTVKFCREGHTDIFYFSCRGDNCPLCEKIEEVAVLLAEKVLLVDALEVFTRQVDTVLELTKPSEEVIICKSRLRA